MIIRIASAEALTDESLRKFVKQDKDGFYIDLPDSRSGDGDGDGDGDKKRLAEFRDNNIKLKKQNEELMRKLEGIDPEALEMGRAALDKARNDRERDLIKAGRFDDVFELRMQEARAQHAKELKKLTDDLQAESNRASKLHKDLSSTKIASHILAKAAEHKLQILPTAQQDFIRRAHDVYTLNDDGQVVAVDGDGQPRFNAERRPFTELDFFKSVVEEAPHLIAQTRGAGIDGGAGVRRNGVMSIDSSDHKAFGSNLEKIAKGEIKVNIK